MDINGTESADTYDQSTIGPGPDWHNYFGRGGNDTIRMYQGNAIGGPGNDIIEALVSTDWWRSLIVGYWDSPAGVNVDLAAGWADDGWGTRDTLIGPINGVSGSWRDDIMRGNAGNNSFWPNGGKDTIDGRGGVDVVGLGWQKGDPDDLSHYNIVVSPDGVRATITSKTDANLRYELYNIEKLSYWDNVRNTSVEFDIGSFIKPLDLATQGLVAASHQRWNAASPMGTAVSVTYSFVETSPTSGPGATGFRPFTSTERQMVRDIFNATSALTGLTFTEVAESGATIGQIRLGVSAQTATKGQAFLPDVAATNPSAGDVWMDTDSMVGIKPGSEGYAALLHEIGHALGLRHPRNVDPGDAWADQFRAADDQTSLTVMSGTASADGLFRADWGLLDVAALQYLYGKRPLNAGDSVYLVGAFDARAQRTIVDDGGVDTIDASKSPVGVSIDLRDGRASSVGVTEQGLTSLDNLGIAIGAVIESAVGSSSDDVLLGNSKDNLLTGGPGNDWLDGSAGTDTAVFSGVRSDYFISTGFGKVFVAARDGQGGFDTLLSIERLTFADSSVALSTAAMAADWQIITEQGLVTKGALPAPTDLVRATVTYGKASEPKNGSVAIAADGSFTYQSSSLYVGDDSFSFSVADGKGGVNTYMAFVKLLTSQQVPVTKAGTSAAETLLGTPIADGIAGAGGNDVIDGGEGNDYAIFSGNSAEYLIGFDASASVYTIKDATNGRDGIDRLVSIELLQFSDGAKQLTTTDALLVGRVNQALLGKAQGSLAFSDSLTKVGPAGNTLDWVKAQASAVLGLSDAAFATLVLNNIGITNKSLIATPTFGSPQQAYDALLGAMTGYLGLVGNASRGIVAAQLATIIAGFEGETVYGVYGNAATAFNKQVGSNLAHSINTGNATGIIAVPVMAAGAATATGNDFSYMLAMGNYAYQINGFSAGDKIIGPAGATANFINTSATDGSASLQYTVNGQTVSITLTGLTNAQDSALTGLSAFNTLFGTGTLA